MEKYSVLMSVYVKENPQYLRESIESMLNQTVKCDQFVIVEDGRLTTDLEKVIDEYNNSYRGLFTIIKYEKNLGLGKALNIGLNYCKNDLIARMDSDDISRLDRCEKQLNIFKNNPNLDICSSNISEFFGDINNVKSIRTVPEHQEGIKKRSRIRSAFNHPAVMYRKSAVLRCGGYSNMERKQDHDLFSRMMNNNCQAYNIQETLLYYRISEDNLHRRRNWKNCKWYLIAQYKMLKRKECNIAEYLFVVCSQLCFLILPESVINWITKKYLRKTVEKQTP